MNQQEKFKILYLEDQKVYWQVFAEHCSNESRTIIVASTTNEAIEIFKLSKSKIDLIVSDYRLAENTCNSFLEYLISTNQSIPVIIFSSETKSEIVQNIKYEHILTAIEKNNFPALTNCIHIFQSVTRAWRVG